EDLGLEPDGDDTPPGSPAANRTANVVDLAWAAVDWTLGRAMRTARFWWIMVGYFCGLFAWYAVQVHQTKYLVEIGFSPTDAAWALGVVSLAGIPGQIALGHLSDRIGREWVCTVGSLGFALCYLALLVLRHRPPPAAPCGRSPGASRVRRRPARAGAPLSRSPGWVTTARSCPISALITSTSAGKKPPAA